MQTIKNILGNTSDIPQATQEDLKKEFGEKFSKLDRETRLQKLNEYNDTKEKVIQFVLAGNAQEIDVTKMTKYERAGLEAAIQALDQKILPSLDRNNYAMGVTGMGLMAGATLTAGL